MIARLKTFLKTWKVGDWILFTVGIPWSLLLATLYLYTGDTAEAFDQLIFAWAFFAGAVWWGLLGK